ncbi:hypothetical protein [Pseudomonas sp. MWU12-2037]|uniref:hypothetical protein n=1 Tax=Pseudomonas sp. MWU12-2037 TaxID=2928690 RepID=UPI00200F0560|nr:hypothetical protein [Pseudomonas sp. MWU12-2037]
MAPLQDPPASTSTIARCITSLVVVLIPMMWALITYLVPDPSVLGFSFISWRNIVLLASAFLFFIAISIGWQIRNYKPTFRGTLQLFIAAVLSFGFFILGSEYSKPSFDFARLQSKIVENEGRNLLGKRMEVLDNVRIELVDCENIGRLPTCTFELTNLSVDRSFRFSEKTQLFDESGGPLKFESIRVGQAEEKHWLQFQLVRNVPTRVTLNFQKSNHKLNKTPAIKLMFRDLNGETLALKFNEIEMQ